MKTKLLFYTIQKLKNTLKLNGIFTYLIIFFITVSSYSQSEGMTFTCGTIIFNFDSEPAGVINGYSYWTGGSAAGSSDQFVLFVQNDNSQGTGDDRWEVHPDIGGFPGIDVGPEDPPIEGTYGVLYFYSYDFNDVSPLCNSEWIIQETFFLTYCATVTATCIGGPITGDCFTYYTDTDEDGFGSVLDMEGEEFCSDPGVGYSLTNDDCNDEDASINPGADEICDGQDNNCIGGVDEDIEDCTNGVIIEYCNDAKTKILVCHNGKDICVSINAMPAHEAHGDYIGSCANASREGGIDISEENLATYDVVSWPNPTNNLFNIKMITPNSIDKVDLKSFDMNGRLIHSNIINGNEDYQFGGELSSGIYFVRLSQADITKVIKLIKQ